MGLPEKKVTEQTAIGALALTDICYVVDDPGGSPLSRKATFQQVADVVKTGFAGQIPFPATQNASSNANTLDDYEEGTWTPGITFGGASVGMTFGTGDARYTKVGRLVYIFALIILTSKGSSEGDAKVTGLPFTIKRAIGSLVALGNFASLTPGGSVFLSSSGSSSTEALIIIQTATIYDGLTHDNFTDSSEMRLMLIGEVA